MSPTTTKEHILLSTIFAIEKHGLPNLTTRLVAQEAGVNNAALHYYFGTKEELIDAALTQTASHMLDDTAEILAQDNPIDVRIRAMLTYIIEGVVQYPNIIRAHMLGPLYYSQRQRELSHLLESWVELTMAALAPKITSERTRQTQFSLNMIFSFILMSGLFNSPAEEYGWLDLQDEDERTAFLDQAIEMLLEV